MRPSMTTLVRADQITTSNVVVESDGFCWNVQVVEIIGRSVFLTMVPRYESMTAQKHKLRIGASRRIRIAAFYYDSNSSLWEVC